MSGVISARTTREERTALRQQAREMGLDNLSDLIRIRCGLSRGMGPTAPLPDIERVNDGSVTELSKAIIQLLDRIDTQNTALKRIMRHLNVPEPVQRGTQPRTEHQPAVMPAGFSR